MKDIIPKEILDCVEWEKPHHNSSIDQLQFPGIKRVIPKKCEDCNASLQKMRIIEYRKKQYPYEHWSELCKGCGFYKNLINNKFEWTNAELRTFLEQEIRNNDK